MPPGRARSRRRAFKTFESTISRSDFESYMIHVPFLHPKIVALAHLGERQTEVHFSHISEGTVFDPQKRHHLSLRFFGHQFGWTCERYSQLGFRFSVLHRFASDRLHAINESVIDVGSGGNVLTSWCLSKFIPTQFSLLPFFQLLILDVACIPGNGNALCTPRAGCQESDISVWKKLCELVIRRLIQVSKPSRDAALLRDGRVEIATWELEIRARD